MGNQTAVLFNSRGALFQYQSEDNDWVGVPYFTDFLNLWW